MKSFDPDLYKAATEGLEWEILSHKLEIGEPDGHILSMSTLNKKGGQQMVEHEFPAVARLSTFVSRVELQVNGRVSVEMARRKLAEGGMPLIAHSPDFEGLLSYVLNVGGKDGKYMI